MHLRHLPAFTHEKVPEVCRHCGDLLHDTLTTMQEMLSLLPRWKASLVRRTAAASAVGMFCGYRREDAVSASWFVAAWLTAKTAAACTDTTRSDENLRPCAALLAGRQL
jgi:hypothetical protein